MLCHISRFEATCNIGIKIEIFARYFRYCFGFGKLICISGIDIEIELRSIQVEL